MLTLTNILLIFIAISLWAIHSVLRSIQSSLLSLDALGKSGDYTTVLDRIENNSEVIKEMLKDEFEYTIGPPYYDRMDDNDILHPPHPLDES